MANQLHNICVARVSTVSFFVLTQLGTHLEAISRAGAQVTVIASDDEYSKYLKYSNHYEFKPICIEKEINIFTDFIALLRLWKLFRTRRFDIVHSTTPKAGLLCAIASRLACVPICLHTFTGQPWVTLGSFKKRVIKFCDKLIVRLNTQCYVDSSSQRDFLVKNKVASLDKLKVMGSGSLAGIDLGRFCQESFSLVVKNRIRKSLSIGADSQIILFVGRVTKDKGINELLLAFKNILAVSNDIVVLIVGPFEHNEEAEIRARAYQHCRDKVIFTGFTQEPERFMAVADVLCIPSYREGFGTVVIEAAAMGIPAIGSRIYGLIDAIVEGETGLLVEPKNVAELTEALQKLVNNEQLRLTLGANAKRRAIKEFDSKKCGEILVREYRDLLK